MHFCVTSKYVYNKKSNTVQIWYFKNLQFVRELKLQKMDCQLDPTDALIIAQILADPDSKFFFTHDQKILYNTAITTYEARLRDLGERSTVLKIKDGLD